MVAMSFFCISPPVSICLHLLGNSCEHDLRGFSYSAESLPFYEVLLQIICQIFKAQLSSAALQLPLRQMYY